jgi:hypothetical protein
MLHIPKALMSGPSGKPAVPVFCHFSVSLLNKYTGLKWMLHLWDEIMKKSAGEGGNCHLADMDKWG